MDVLIKQRRNRAQVRCGLAAFHGPGPSIGPVCHVGLCKARVTQAGHDCIDVVD